MLARVVAGITIEVARGDIAAQKGFDVVVNAANAELRRGGGVAGAIHRAAGPGLEAESRRLGPIKPGQCVITGAYDLPNRYVIHCLGPVYGIDKPEAVRLAECYRNALRLAEDKKAASIAFPAISTGIFCYPVDEAAETALKTIIETAPSLKSVKRVRIVLWSAEDLDVHERTLARLTAETDGAAD